MSTGRSLIKGSIFRTVELLVLLGVTFFVTPFIVHSLGARMYGFWTLLGAFIGYYGLLDFGLSSAAARFLSQSLGKGDAEDLSAVASTVFFLFSLIGLAALATTLIMVGACPWFIADPAEAALFRRIMLLLGVATAAGFPLRVYTGILTSHLRYDAIAYIGIARTVASNAAIYCVLARGGGITAVAVVSFFASLFQSAAAFAVCAAQYPEVKVAGFRFDRAKIGAMFDHSWKNFVCQLGDMLRFRVDSLMIAYFLGVGLVTPYAIGVRLVEGLTQVVMSSVGMMQPVFSRYEGSGDFDAIRRALLRSAAVSSMLSAFMGMSLLFYGKAFILRWMGPGFESSYYVAAILCVALIVELTQSPGVQLLYGLSRHDAYAALNAVEAVLNVALSVLFLRWFGLYGVVLGTAVEIVLIKLFVLPYYICRVVDMPLKAYLLDAVLVTLAKTAVPLALYYWLIQGRILPDYTRLLACFALQGALFLPTAYFLIMSRDERRVLNLAAAALLARAAVRPGVDAA